MRNYHCDGCGRELKLHDIKIFAPPIDPVSPKFDLCSTCHRRAFESAIEKIHEIKISVEREKMAEGAGM